MNYRNMLKILCIAIVFSLFCGCQLAIEGAGEERVRDNIVGILVTYDYINLINSESIDIGKLLLEVKAPEAKPNKIFATKGEGGTYFFDGIEGMYYFYEKVNTDEAKMTVMHGNDGFSDANMKVSDNTNELSATLSYCGEKNNNFFLNPVYQASDGGIYTIPGSGVSGGVDLSTTFSETNTITENGKKTEQKSSVEIKLEKVNEIEKIIIKQMSDEDHVVERTEITKDKIPDFIEVKSDTAYMFAEVYDDESEIERTFIKNGEKNYTCHFSNDKGIIVGHIVDFLEVN